MPRQAKCGPWKLVFGYPDGREQSLEFVTDTGKHPTARGDRARAVVDRQLREGKMKNTKRSFLARGMAMFGSAAILLAFTNGSLNDGGIFELDGNAVSNGAHDWDQVYADSLIPGSTATSGASAISFQHDLVTTTSDDEFTGGGAKDISGIQQGPWLYNSSKPQPKDDIADAFAAAYSSNGHTFLYFGMDRYSNSGDSTVGFWFFQDSAVGLGSTKQGGGTRFTGVHMDGDLLIVADFSIGGSNPTINAYRWSGNDATGTLVNVPVPSGAFAIVNGSPQVAPWPFQDKTNTQVNGQNAFAAGELFEGGVDLNVIFGSTVPCFTKFMGETRSSTSPTATLSDFSKPANFPLCGLGIAKACGTPTVNAAGNSITYPVNGTVKNTGIGTLYNVTVFDTPTSPAGSQKTRPVTNNTAGSPNNGTNTLGAGETGTWSDSTTSTQASVSDSAFVQASLSTSVIPDGACAPNNTTCTPQDDTVISSVTLAGSNGSGGIANATCTSQFSTALSITKNCGIPAAQNNGTAVPGVTLTVSNSVVGVQVNVSGQVCNNGVSEIKNIGLTDAPAATITLGASTLAPGACTSYSATYVPSNIDQVVGGVGGPGAGRYFFNDLITISSASADVGSLCTLNSPNCPTGPAACTGKFGCASQSCPICQGSGECTVQ